MAASPYGTANYDRNTAVFDYPLGAATGPNGQSVACAALVASTGQYTSNLALLSDGAFSTPVLGSRGELIVRPGGNGTSTSDGMANSIILGTNQSGAQQPLGVFGYYWNGTTIDRMRGDTSGAFVKSAPLSGTDRSATATTTSAQLMAANATRSKFFVRNDSAVDVWINMGATAVATAGSGNIKIASGGGYFEFAGYSGVVNIIAASSTAAITAREF